MTTPTWLTEMHRQWHKARGRRIGTPSRPFSRDWQKLLDDSGIVSSEEIKTAERDLEALEKEGRLLLKRHRYRRHNIEKIILPLENEEWWIAYFGGTPARDLIARALAVLKDFTKREHSVSPAEWETLLATLHLRFTDGNNLHPFKWTEPENLQETLELCWKLTEREWQPGTLIRTASLAIGMDSKGLEERKAVIESALSLLFCEKFELKSLGLAEGDTHVELSGIFQLHFPDGTSQKIDNLRIAKIGTTDIFRCESITTDATELLTIENRKTTFRQYAELNRNGSKLIATTSFPGPTFREFLRKLPEGIVHQHFGDTDPAGWLILLKLREATPRHVDAFRMKWRPGKIPSPLSAYDRKHLPKLLSSERLQDVRAEIAAILSNNDKGDYEQESLGMASH